jgi:hypothetical protein
MRVDRLRVCTLASVFTATFVMTAGGQQTVRWSLDARPAVTIGGDDRDTTTILQTIVGATRLPDGAILVGDRGDYALRFFSPTGSPLRSVGRSGSGPGEVRYLARLFRCGDSVYTYDIGEGHRVSVFTLRGTFVRAFRFGTPQAAQSPYQSACNRNGEFVHLGWEQPRDIRGGVFRSVVPVWTSRADSTVGRVIDSLPGSERWGLVRDGQLRGTRPLPLGKQPVLGIGRSAIFLGSADQFQILALSSRGESIGTLRRGETPMAVTRADIRDAIGREIANRGESSRKDVEAAYAEMTLPATLPAYTDLRVDTEDLVWVRSYPRGSPSSVRWSVFDAKGTLAAEINLPTHLEVFEIGANYVLGRYLDPAEAIPQVRLYHFKRQPK